LDPWGNAFQVYWFQAGGSMGAGGGVVLVCKGANGALDTSSANIAAGVPSSDDEIIVVSRKL
jgi:hypothetical protein